MDRKLESIISELKTDKEYIRNRYKAEIIGVFGSFVRNEQKQTSDIDLLVRFLEGASLFDFIGLANFLEDKLKDSIYKEVVKI
jgi:predicted nucleotidyltransferase